MDTLLFLIKPEEQEEEIQVECEKLENVWKVYRSDIRITVRSVRTKW